MNALPPTPATPTPVQTPPPPGPITKAAMGVLIVLGVAFMGVGLALWLSGGDSATSTTSTVASTGQQTTGKTNTTGKNSAGGDGSNSASGSKQDQRTDIDQSVITSGDQSDRSDTFTIGLLGFGVALLLTGTLFPRISKISFPGGGIELTPQGVGAVARLAAANDPELGNDQESARALVLAVLDTVTPKHVDASEAFSEKFVSEAVRAVRPDEQS